LPQWNCGVLTFIETIKIMTAQIATIDDLHAMESRLSIKIEEMKVSIKPRIRWVKGSVFQEAYGFSPNKIKKLRRSGEIKSKKTGETYMYDIINYEESENN
jgi:hypothetical protein